jgi:hypothetical protein
MAMQDIREIVSAPVYTVITDNSIVGPARQAFVARHQLHRIMSEEPEEEGLESGEEFGELVRYTLAGYVGGILLGGTLDWLGLQRSGLGQGAVRTLAGEGESILEGIYALRKRLAGSAGSMAEAYGWGKLLGMAFPWIVDGMSRLAGVDVYGVQAFYIPFFYGLSDQIGANVSGLLFLKKRARSWRGALAAYLKHGVMLSGLIIILAVPAGLAAARAWGFSPSTQVLTALETIAANLCWIPPLIGWLGERRRARSQ